MIRSAVSTSGVTVWIAGKWSMIQWAMIAEYEVFSDVCFWACVWGSPFLAPKPRLSRRRSRLLSRLVNHLFNR